MDYDADLRAIKRTWASFVRFAAGFCNRATWLARWYQAKSTYFAAFDAIVAQNSRLNIGLIPLLLWDCRGFTDICYTTAGATPASVTPGHKTAQPICCSKSSWLTW